MERIFIKMERFIKEKGKISLSMLNWVSRIPKKEIGCELIVC
jgi:hypothetical protein